MIWIKQLLIKADLEGKMPKLVSIYKKFKPDIADEEIIKQIKELNEKVDPSGNSADYMPFIVKMFAKDILKPGQFINVKDNLELLHEFKNKPAFKEAVSRGELTTNTEQWENLDMLTKIVDNAYKYKSENQKEKERKLKEHGVKGAEIIRHQDGFDVYKVTDAKASQWLCYREVEHIDDPKEKENNVSQVCVRHESTAKGYLTRGPLYFFVKDGKVQYTLHHPNNKGWQIKNREDVSLNTKEASEIYNIIKALFPGFDNDVKSTRNTSKRDDEDIYTVEELEHLGLLDEDEDDDLLSFTQLMAPSATSKISQEEKLSKILTDDRIGGWGLASYAINILKRPWEAAEPRIIEDPYASMNYIKSFFPNGWDKAEDVIKTAPSLAARYARDILKHRWEAAESSILTNAQASVMYAKAFFPDGWTDAEPIISTDANAAYDYANSIKKAPWPKGEPKILENAETAWLYIKNVLKKRWPLLDEVILKKTRAHEDFVRSQAIIQYLSDYVGEWPELQQLILDKLQTGDTYATSIAANYAHNVMKRRWPEAEVYIMKQENLVFVYLEQTVKARWPELEEFIETDTRNNDEQRMKLFKHYVAIMKKLSINVQDLINKYNITATSDLHITWSKKIINASKQLLIKADGENLPTEDWTEELKEFKHSSRKLVEWAIDSIGHRWIEAEPYILSDIYQAIIYAKNFFSKVGWPELETLLLREAQGSKHFHYSSLSEYAVDVLKRRWPEVEPFILKSLRAIGVYFDSPLFTNRWLEAEEVLRDPPGYFYNSKALSKYAAILAKKGKKLDMELHLELVQSEDSSALYQYAKKTLKGERDRMIEQALLNNLKTRGGWAARQVTYAFRYALNIVKGEWPEFEKVLLSKDLGDLWTGGHRYVDTAVKYAIEVKKARWTELETQLIDRFPVPRRRYEEAFGITLPLKQKRISWKKLAYYNNAKTTFKRYNRFS